MVQLRREQWLRCHVWLGAAGQEPWKLAPCNPGLCPRASINGWKSRRALPGRAVPATSVLARQGDADAL